MGFILKEKLKNFKEHLKIWNKEVYGALETKILTLIGDIQEKDFRREEGVLTTSEVVLRKNLFSALWHLLKSKESIGVQRSRSRW
jgi:hypothetical protein